MGNLLFSPNGRINPGDFTKGALVLIIIGAILNFLPLLGAGKGLQQVLSVVPYLLIYPWICLFMKRFRDAGKSGWMSLIPFAVYVVGALVLTFGLLGGEIMSMAESINEGGDPEAMAEEMVKGKMLPMAIASTLLSVVIAFGFNAILKRDDHENQFGPAS